MSSSTPDRFAATAADVAALQDTRADALSEEALAFVLPEGDERVLDVGTGAGALAFALAPRVRAVVALDRVPELLAEARTRAGAYGNVEVVEADATSLPFEDGSFDLACTLRTLHHVARPELVVAELVRVTHAGGRVLVADQLAPADPLAALELDRFERARDQGHARLLPDADLRQLFEANGLVLLRERRRTDRRDLAAYLDHAGCSGEARARAEALAPAGGLEATVGWYLLARP